MRPRGSPPDRDVCGTKLRHRCCEHPQGGSFTVVGSGRIGIFRCQPVVDTYTGQLRAIRDRFEPRILEIRAAHETAAAMEMEVDALGCGGSADPKRDRTDRRGDFDDTRAWRRIDGEQASPALSLRPPDRLGRIRPTRRQPGNPCTMDAASVE